jgi:hypothetical protein
MAINVDYKGVETGVLDANTATTLVPGRPVYIGASGVTAAGANSDVLGLVREMQYSGVLNEVTGQYGIYGSGKVTVLCKGIATVQNSVINGTSYAVYDTTLTYVAGDKLYSTAAGLISNTSGYNGITAGYIGKCLKIPTNAANGDPMTIEVE